MMPAASCIPIGAEGQIEGGVVMGLGMALWEKVARDGGYIQNPGMRDYLLPGPKDVPREITTIFVENADDTGPYGAKGVAEASLIPVPAAVAAGVYDAVRREAQSHADGGRNLGRSPRRGRERAERCLSRNSCAQPRSRGRSPRSAARHTTASSSPAASWLVR